MVLFNANVKVNGIKAKCPKDWRRNPKFITFIRGLPCICTGSTQNIDPHHRKTLLPEYSHWVGKGLKSPDVFAVPVTHDIHMGFHANGDERVYFGQWGIDLDEYNTVLMNSFYDGNKDKAVKFILERL